MNRFKTLTIVLLLGISIISKAQNTGPVAPEAKSFEPIDANNMVNMLTGDFTYVIPLLNIPSPEGGYPIALSYHGGITMDQEASWVGLGWNINPGAISRNVNGYPDDWNGKYTSTIMYNPGGVIETYSVGVGLGFGLGENAVASVGLDYTWGSYKSLGISLGFFDKTGLSEKSGFGLNVSYDTHSGDFGLGVGNGVFDLSVSSSGSVGLSAGLSAGLTDYNSKNEQFGVGVSFSSGKASGSITAGGMGFSKVSSSSDTDGLNVDISGFRVTLPLYYFSVSFSHQRIHYWYFNDNSDVTYGLLYSNLANNTANFQDLSFKYEQGIQDKNSRMDSYTIPFKESTLNQDNADLYNNQLLLMAPDNYGVTGQGIAGSITPRNYQNNLVTYNSKIDNKVNTNDVLYYNTFSTIPTLQSYDPQFSFDNDISGHISVSPGTFTGDYAYDVTFNGGNIQTTIDYKGKPYNGFVNNRKVSGNYVEWFTNSQINDGTAKSKSFLECNTLLSKRNDLELFDSAGIGGFKVTAIDGKTYHYALPVYQFEEFLRKNGKKIGEFLESRKLDPYATSWLLTAVTGPDYYDKNDNGIADEGDYGYWVCFNYGKLTDGYIWQLPYDLEGKAYYDYQKIIRWGRKQIYYLNSIETRTHIAYFIKEAREDGLGKTVNTIMNPILVQGWNWRNIPKGIWFDLKTNGDYTGPNFRNYDRETSYSYNVDKSEKTLKLKKILLLKKDKNNTNAIINKTSLINSSGVIDVLDKLSIYNVDQAPLAINTHHDFDRYLTKGFNRVFSSNYNDVLMLNNISNYSDLETRATQTINFLYSYDLCNNTPNSISTYKGKLTLQGVEMLGRNGKKILPAYLFGYKMLADNNFNLDGKDLWGYPSDSPDKWSLNEILLPTGGKIKINYEKNTFKNDAVSSDKIQIISSGFDENIAIIKIAADIRGFNIGDKITLSGKVYFEELHETVDPYDGRVSYNWIGSNYPQDIFGEATISGIGQDSTITFSSPSFFPPIYDYQRNVSIVGNLVNLPNSLTQYGGGVRVKSIQTVDELNNTYSTAYTYTIPGTDNYTSGTICYSPYAYEKKFIPYVTELPGPKVLYNYVTVTQSGAGKTGPSTVYEFDTYKNAIVGELDFTMGDQFKVVNSQQAEYIGTYNDGNHYGSINARSAIIYNNLASVGRLISTKRYNNIGQEIGSQKNTYYNPDELKIGYQQESFSYVKRNLAIVQYDFFHSLQTGILDITKSNNEWFFGSANRITYPSIPKSLLVEANGKQKEITYDSYDLYSGNVLKTITKDFDNSYYLSEVIPAYQISSYYEMGSKSVDPNRMNMISQEAGTLSFIGDGVNWKPVSIGIQTWNNSWKERVYDENNSGFTDQQQPNVWRKHKSFIWKGGLDSDGAYSDFTSYETSDKLITSWSLFHDDSENGWKTTNWQKTSEITRYNRYSQALESVDINDHAASARLNIDETQTIATAANSLQSQFTASGFEDSKEHSSKFEFDGQILSAKDRVARKLSNDAPQTMLGSRNDSINAHTGYYYIQINGGEGGNPGVKLSSAAKKYKVSVWVHKNSTNAILGMSGTTLPDNIPVNSSEVMNSTNSKLFGEWYLFSTVFNSPSSTLDGLYFYLNCSGVGNIAYFDDFRVQPIGSSVSSYVYDPITDALNYILNNDNIATKYDYNDAGNLKATYKETETGFKKVSEHNQGYARPVDNAIALASEITATTYVNTQTEKRVVTLTIKVTNNDIVSRQTNLNVELYNGGSKSFSNLIESKKSITLTTSFDIEIGDVESRQVNITGDIHASQMITILKTPATIKIVDFSIDESGQIIIGSSVSANAVVKNIGLETGTFKIVWRHSSPNNEEDSEPTTFTLAPGASTSISNIYSTIQPVGGHSFSFSILQQNDEEHISSGNLYLECINDTGSQQ